MRLRRGLIALSAVVAVSVAILWLLGTERADRPDAPEALRRAEPPKQPALLGRADPLGPTATPTAPPPEPRAGGDAGATGAVEGTVTLWDGSLGADLEVWLVPADEAVPPRGLAKNWEMEDNPRGLPSARTDAEGRFVLPLPASSRRAEAPWTVVARLALSAEARSPSFPLPAAAKRARHDVVVPEPGLLRVRLTGSTDSIPRLGQLDLEGSLSWISLPREHDLPPEWDLREEEPQSGRYAVRTLPGRYRVRAWIESGPHVEGEVEVVAGREVEWAAVVPLEGSVSGRVVDADGNPVSRGAMVTWYGRSHVSTQVDAEGRFQLSGLGREAGRIEVNAFFGGGHLQRDGVVPDGPALTLVVRDPPVVTARVEGLAPGTELRSLELSRGLTGGGHPRIEADGRIRLAGRFEHPTLLVFSIPDVAPILVHVPVLELESEHDLGMLRFGPGVSFEGRVVDAEERPVSGAEVAIADRWATALHVSPVTTPADGTFRFDRVPPEPLFLRVRGAERPQHVQRVDPTAAEPCRLVVTQGGRAEVEVVDPDGGPLSDVRVVVSLAEDLPFDGDGDSTRRSIPVGLDGRRTLLLCAGPRRLKAYGPKGRTSAPVSVTIGEGQTTSVRLILGPPRGH